VILDDWQDFRNVAGYETRLPSISSLLPSSHSPT